MGNDQQSSRHAGCFVRCHLRIDCAYLLGLSSSSRPQMQHLFLLTKPLLPAAVVAGWSHGDSGSRISRLVGVELPPSTSHDESAPFPCLTHLLGCHRLCPSLWATGLMPSQSPNAGRLPCRMAREISEISVRLTAYVAANHRNVYQ